MSDCFGVYAECESCTGPSKYEPCIAELRILGNIIAKLNGEEKSMLFQMLDKARSAGEIDMIEAIRAMYKAEKESA